MKTLALGFNLIELCVVMALLSMASMGAAKGLMYWRERAVAASALTLMHHDLLYAQQLARGYHAQVTLCGSRAGFRCDGAWSKGRLALLGSGRSGKRLFYHRLSLKHARWLWRSSLGKNDRLIFGPQGDNLGQRGSFYFCTNEQQEKQEKRLVINQAGRITRRDTSDAVCRRS